jgi:uncharacterized protein YndB with AHSA1/START domain
MSAVADVAAGTIHAAIDLPAPPDRVFQALTTPAQLAAWWGSEDLYRTHSWQVDLRVGGVWSCQAEGPQGKSSVRGKYLEIDRPKLLVVTWEPSWDDFQTTTIRYDLQPTPAGTRLKVTHTGFGPRADSCQGHAAGWNRVLEWLAAHLAGSKET